MCLGLLILSAALASCTDSSPAATRALRPSGTELGPDFVVPEGTRLIGTRFPGLQDGSWEALLLLDDDPRDVLLDLARQAQASRLDIGTWNNTGSACSVHAETLLECDLIAVGESPARSYSFGLRWGVDAGAHYRHVLVQSEPRLYGVDVPDEDLTTNPPQRPRVALPSAPNDVDAWTQPSIGDLVAQTPRWFERTVVERERGAALIAMPGPAWCLTGGYTAVLELDHGADARDVVTRYAEQFEAFGFEGSTGGGTFEGRDYLAARYSAAGGGELEAVATASDDGQEVLWLSRCND